MGIVAFIMIGKAAVVVSVGVLRVQCYGTDEIGYGFVVVTFEAMGKGAVAESQGSERAGI